MVCIKKKKISSWHLKHVLNRIWLPDIQYPLFCCCMCSLYIQVFHQEIASHWFTHITLVMHYILWPSGAAHWCLPTNLKVDRPSFIPLRTTPPFKSRARLDLTPPFLKIQGRHPSRFFSVVAARWWYELPHLSDQLSHCLSPNKGWSTSFSLSTEMSTKTSTWILLLDQLELTQWQLVMVLDGKLKSNSYQFLDNEIIEVEQCLVSQGLIKNYYTYWKADREVLSWGCGG